MKKLGQKASFLTKILLVVGLLISNLSSLSVVFAYEGTQPFVVALNNDVLKIKYFEQLPEEVEAVKVKVYENYTYLDGSFEDEIEKVYSLTDEEFLAASEGTLELTYNSMFADEVVEEALEETSPSEEKTDYYKFFDGTYDVRVELVGLVEDTAEETEVVGEEAEESTPTYSETVLGTAIYEKTMTHRNGLNIKLFDSNNVEITKVDGKYPVATDNNQVNVVAQILSGGLSPKDEFVYEDTNYYAYELIEKGFSSSVDFDGYLYGEYNIPVEVKLSKPLPTVDEESLSEETTVDVTQEEVVYTDEVTVLYGSYELITDELNLVVEEVGYEKTYIFMGDSKEGELYLLLDLDEVAVVDLEENAPTKTALDLYELIMAAFDEEPADDDLVTYSILKGGVDVMDGYDASLGVSIQEYLSTIALDDTVVLALSCKDLTVTYRVVIVGDLNNDNTLTREDVSLLIEQAIGKTEVTDVKKSDIADLNGKVEVLDALALKSIVDLKSWTTTYEESDATLDAELVVKFNGEELSEENILTSGDDFTVEYVLSLTDYEVNGFAGLFEYDEELFELVSVETSYDWLGSSYEGKFLYLGDESLTGSDQTENQESVVTTEDTSEEYVVVSATFKALSATEEGVITLEEIELYNLTEDGIKYYNLDNNSLSTDVITVGASDNNKLTYLSVAGQEIELLDEVFEYEITVSHDVTAAEVLAETENVAAKITSIVYPEELVEGENEVIVTVVSETGVEQVYTIKVIKEAEPKEVVQQVSSDNYYGDYDNEKEEVVVTEPEEEEPKEKESNFSRIVIIILILIVIAGLIYLIFKDEDDETKKTNKEINKLKKEEKEIVAKTSSANTKPKNKAPNSNKTKGTKNTKKER